MRFVAQLYQVLSLRASFRSFDRNAAIDQRLHDILERSSTPEEIKALENKPNFCVSHT